jgi:hypothetical protein
MVGSGPAQSSGSGLYAMFQPDEIGKPDTFFLTRISFVGAFGLFHEHAVTVDSRRFITPVRPRATVAPYFPGMFRDPPFWPPACNLCPGRPKHA